MRAIVRDRFGTPAQLREAELPLPAPGPGEVLVRVHAAAVNPADVFFLTGRPLLTRPLSGLVRPRHPVLGRDVAGVVESVGAGVDTVQPGDAVIGEVEFGTFAEYVVAPADRFAAKPERLGFDAAAALPLAGVTALQGLRDAGRLSPGEHVLVVGAAGGVGSYAVQIAKAMGAQVTAVVRTDAVDLVRSLGADHVVDYTRDNPDAGGQHYDVILDVAGSHSVSAFRRMLTPTGRYVSSTGRLSRLVAAGAASVLHRGRVVVLVAKANAEDLTHLAQLVDSGAVTPVVDRTYPLSDTAAALQHLVDGHARGKTVVEVVPG